MAASRGVVGFRGLVLGVSGLELGLRGFSVARCVEFGHRGLGEVAAGDGPFDFNRDYQHTWHSRDQLAVEIFDWIETW